MKFDALSGVSQSTTTRQEVTPSYYLYAQKNDTCIALVQSTGSSDKKVVLGDPYVTSYILSFNPFLAAVYVAPNKGTTVTWTKGSADAQGIIAVVGACIMIVVSVLLCGYCCIKEHELKKKQYRLEQEEKEEEQDEEARDAEQALLDSAARAGAAEQTESRLD